MIYARQVDPEFQSSSIFENFPENIAVCGNRDYIERLPKVFKRVRHVLNEGVLAEIIVDISDGRDTYMAETYGNAKAAIVDFLPSEKERYSESDFINLEKLIVDYTDWSVSRGKEEYLLCSVLSIVTGEKWDYSQISGCCQSDWNYIYYPVKDWSKKVIDEFEKEYFNTGSEWIVLENPDDIFGYSIYCHYYNEDDIREEIARNEGVKITDVIMYDYYGNIIECNLKTIDDLLNYASRMSFHRIEKKESVG